MSCCVDKWVTWNLNDETLIGSERRESRDDALERATFTRTVWDWILSARSYWQMHIWPFALESTGWWILRKKHSRSLYFAWGTEFLRIFSYRHTQMPGPNLTCFSSSRNFAPAMLSCSEEFPRSLHRDLFSEFRAYSLSHLLWETFLGLSK